MRHLAATSLGIFTLLLISAANAQSSGPAVPVTQASYHLPVFKNEYITMVNIFIPPGGRSGYHIHTGQSVTVNIEEADMMTQDLGEPEAKPAAGGLVGRVNYTDYDLKPRTHQATNVGSNPFHNILFIFNSPRPRGFAPSSRTDVPSYKQVLDNERVRGWRLVLDPGQSASPITQQAPGFRVVISEGEVVESVPGSPDRAMYPRRGEFYWQDRGNTRAIRNIGTTRVEFVEFELK